MLKGVTDVAAVCVGLLGLIGAAATTGMPMWKVTAFIGENIIVMETRWEGLWMNCFRQANIRMQCKVYDSLLFLPPELQAARGLMCCSLALSGVGLLVAFAGMRCVSFIRGNERAKAIILVVAGGMQLLASVCVFIPVSWTGHVIIRDFYNPLLIDAQRRELGEALYIGWVTGGALFASAMLFLCRRVPSQKGSFDIYPSVDLLRYRPQPDQVPMMRYHPLSTVSSLAPTPIADPRPHYAPRLHPPLVYNQGLPETASMLYQANAAPRSSMTSSGRPHSSYTPGTSLYISPGSAPLTHPSTSYQSTFYPVPQTPVFIGYDKSMMHRPSVASSGMYI